MKLFQVFAVCQLYLNIVSSSTIIREIDRSPTPPRSCLFCFIRASHLPRFFLCSFSCWFYIYTRTIVSGGELLLLLFNDCPVDWPSVIIILFTRKLSRMKNLCKKLPHIHLAIYKKPHNVVPVDDDERHGQKSPQSFSQILVMLEQHPRSSSTGIK